MTRPTYSVVVPVYNSELSLAELCARVDKVFGPIVGDYELIMVEDGSEDGSWRVMKSLKNRNRRLKIVRLTKNSGQHNALMCGFSISSGDYIITMDDDLQHPPEEIPNLINAIQNSDFDVVYGVPAGKRKHSPIRRIGGFLYRRLISSAFKCAHHPITGSFRIIRKETLMHIVKIKTPNPIISLLLLKVTQQIGSIEIRHDKRKYGKTTYTMYKLLKHFADGMLYNGTLLLKGLFFLGILTSCIALVFGVYYIISFFLGNTSITGWTTIILLQFFFSGILMLSIGIIGEYLLRILQEARQVPGYFIRDKEL